MTSSTEKQSSTELILADKKIPARISIGDYRRAKQEHNIDLGATSGNADSVVARFQTDVLAVSDLVWTLYRDKLQKVGVATQEDLDEKLEQSDLEEVRRVVSIALRGFFPLMWTLYMGMQEIQAGDQET